MLLLCGCGGSIGIRNSDFEEWNSVHNRVAIETKTLGGATRNFLNSHFLMDRFKMDPDAVIAETENRLRKSLNRTHLEYLIDMCRTSAFACNDKALALKYHTSTCFFTYLYLFDKKITPEPSTFSPGYFLALCYYNEALTKIFKYLQENNLEFKDSFSLPMAVGVYLTFTPPLLKLSLDPEDYKTFLPCSDYQTVNMQTYTHAFGIGIPLISICCKQLSQYTIKIMPGQTFPATVFLRFTSLENNFVHANLEYYDTTNVENITVAKSTVPLQLDFSTPLAYMQENSNPIDGIFYFLNPYEANKIEGLYCLTPFNQNKIPVVFVHGLLSNPNTWTQMTNTLMGNSTIRKNYQFWFFAYATGNPVIYSASLLREALVNVEKQISPEFRKDEFSKMIIVAHSMGGLLSKTLIQDSGRKLIDHSTNAATPVDLKELTPEQIEFLENILVFSHQAYVKRMVFLATPHRGSDLATWMIIRYFSNWVTVSDHLVEKVNTIMVKLKMRKPEDVLYVKTGLDNLDPDSDILISINKLPFAKVPYHSIIGNEDYQECPGGSDGVVPYSSAHLNSSISELVVKSGHSVQEDEAAIEEIKRILLLHLAENGIPDGEVTKTKYKFDE